MWVGLVLTTFALIIAIGHSLMSAGGVDTDYVRNKGMAISVVAGLTNTQMGINNCYASYNARPAGTTSSAPFDWPLIGLLAYTGTGSPRLPGYDIMSFSWIGPVDRAIEVYGTGADYACGLGKPSLDTRALATGASGYPATGFLALDTGSSDVLADAVITLEVTKDACAAIARQISGTDTTPTVPFAAGDIARPDATVVGGYVEPDVPTMPLTSVVGVAGLAGQAQGCFMTSDLKYIAFGSLYVS